MSGAQFWLVYVQGWGFDPSFWDPLRAHLPEIESIAVDLGFRGPPTLPAPPAGRILVGVGHSLGMLWLLKRRLYDWQAAISINGFPRFARGEDFPHGVAPRLLERMIARLSDSPHAVYGDFMRRIGIAEPDLAGLNVEKLAEGLRWLADWDLRPVPEALVQALAGRADPLLPPELSQSAFAGKILAFHESGGHLLPLTDPAWCAARIREALERTC
ncbi:MAG: alpha/beta hydrolase [Rhodospirillales bacterium]|nr:alpha/beta hydrolase [Rhodospirillales bacterium]